MNKYLNIWDKLQKTQHFYSSFPFEDFELIFSELKDDIQNVNLSLDAKNAVEIIIQLIEKKIKKKLTQKEKTSLVYKLQLKLFNFKKYHKAFYNYDIKNISFHNFQKKNELRNIFDGIQIINYENLKLFNIEDKIIYENLEKKEQKKKYLKNLKGKI